MSTKHFYRVFIFLTAAGYLWIGAHFIFGGGSGETICLFRRFTGIPCPSCGTTRSMLVLLHGDFWSALYINPIGIVLAPFLLVLPWWLCIDLLKSNNSLYRASEAVGRTFIRHRSITAIGIILVVINWGWNIFKAL